MAQDFGTVARQKFVIWHRMASNGSFPGLNICTQRFMRVWVCIHKQDAGVWRQSRTNGNQPTTADPVTSAYDEGMSKIVTRKSPSLAPDSTWPSKHMTKKGFVERLLGTNSLDTLVSKPCPVKLASFWGSKQKGARQFQTCRIVQGCVPFAPRC